MKPKDVTKNKKSCLLHALAKALLMSDILTNLLIEKEPAKQKLLAQALRRNAQSFVDITVEIEEATGRKIG